MHRIFQASFRAALLSLSLFCASLLSRTAGGRFRFFPLAGARCSLI